MGKILEKTRGFKWTGWLLCLSLPALLIAQVNPPTKNFSVLPPLDTTDTYTQLISKSRDIFAQKLRTQSNPTFSYTIEEKPQIMPYQGSIYLHNLMDLSLSNRFHSRQVYFSSVNYYFNHVFLQFQTAHLTQNNLGTHIPAPLQSLVFGFKAGFGLGQKVFSGQSQHYPVTMLIGLKSRYSQKVWVEGVNGDKFSGSKNHLLYFTPGMGIEGRTLSFEASLELPIAKYTPQTESQLNRHMRANIEMKYKIE